MELKISDKFIDLTAVEQTEIEGGFLVDLAIGVGACVIYYGASSICKSATGKHIHEWAGDAIMSGYNYVFN